MISESFMEIQVLFWILGFTGLMLMIGRIFYIYIYIFYSKFALYIVFGEEKHRIQKKTRKIREKLAKIGVQMTKVDFSGHFRYIIGPNF